MAIDRRVFSGHCSHHKSEAQAGVTDRAKMCCVPSCQRDFCLTSKQLLAPLHQYTTRWWKFPLFCNSWIFQRDFERVFWNNVQIDFDFLDFSHLHPSRALHVFLKIIKLSLQSGICGYFLCQNKLMTTLDGCSQKVPVKWMKWRRIQDLCVCKSSCWLLFSDMWSKFVSQLYYMMISAFSFVLWKLLMLSFLF